MITTTAIFPEDKPVLRLGADPSGGALLEVRLGLHTRIAIHHMTTFDLHELAKQLDDYIRPVPQAADTFADEEAARQESTISPGT